MQSMRIGKRMRLFTVMLFRWIGRDIYGLGLIIGSADVRRRHNDDDGCTRCADDERKAGTGIQYDDGHGERGKI